MANSNLTGQQWGLYAIPSPELMHALRTTQRRLKRAEAHAKCASLFQDTSNTVALRDAMIARAHATRAHKLRNTLQLLTNGVMSRG